MSRVIKTKAKPPGISEEKKEYVRHAELRILYNGVDASDKFGVIEGFSYDDPAKSEADSVSIEVDNIDERWSNGWYPKQFDRIYCGIVYYDKSGKKRELNCGLFHLDTRDIKGPPKTCSIKALSIPVSKSFTVKPRTKTWHKITVKQICEEKAAEYGIGLTFTSDLADPIETVEQTNETDSAFLKKICEDYGLEIKIYTLSMIVYDQDKMEDADPVSEITPEDCTTYDSNMDIYGSYTGAVISYTDSNTSKTYQVSVGDTTSENARVLFSNESCDSEKDALKKGIAKVNSSNREIYTMSVTLKEPRFIYATQNVMFTGFGSDIDGKYFIDKVTHSLSSGSGYTVQLSGHWCTTRISSDGTTKTEDKVAEAQKAAKKEVKKQEQKAKKAAKKKSKYEEPPWSEI